MDEQFCSTVYYELVEILNELKLGWVAEQVEDVLSAGKTVEEMVMGRKSPDLKLAYYSPQERLSLLIDAIECMVVSGIEMEEEIGDIFHQEGLTVNLKPEVSFVSSIGKKWEFFKFSQPEILERSPNCQQLKTSLEKLRSEVNKNDN